MLKKLLLIAVTYCGVTVSLVYSMEKEIVEKTIEGKDEKKIVEGIEEKKLLQTKTFNLLMYFLSPESLAVMIFSGTFINFIKTVNECNSELLAKKNKKKIITSLSLEDLKTLYNILVGYDVVCKLFLDTEKNIERYKKREIIIQIMTNIIDEWGINNIPKFLKFSKKQDNQTMFSLSKEQLILIDKISLKYSLVNISYMKNSYFGEESYYEYFKKSLGEQLSKKLEEKGALFKLSLQELKDMYEALNYYAYSPSKKDMPKKTDRVKMPKAQDLENCISKLGYDDFLKRTHVIQFLAGKKGSIFGLLSLIRLLIKEYADSYNLSPEDSVLLQSTCRKIADNIFIRMLRELPETQRDVEMFRLFENARGF